MKKWEYRVVDSRDIPKNGRFEGKNRQDVELYLNKLGREGWEIVNIDFRDFDERFEFSGVAKREIIKMFPNQS